MQYIVHRVVIKRKIANITLNYRIYKMCKTYWEAMLYAIKLQMNEPELGIIITSNKIPNRYLRTKSAKATHFIGHNVNIKTIFERAFNTLDNKYLIILPQKETNYVQPTF